MLTKEEMAALRARVTPAQLRAAQCVKLFKQIATMGDTDLNIMGFNPDAVRLVMAEQESAQPSMHGIGANHSLSGWHIVAKNPLKRFYALLSPLDAFSTTYRQDVFVVGNPSTRGSLEIPIYDDSGEAEIDNFDNFDNRDSASSSSAEVKLHKCDDVITIYARDLEKGIEIEPQVEAMLCRVAKKINSYVLSQLAVGSAQGDDATKKVTGVNIPEIGNTDGKFNYGYANQVLSEVIQPRVHSLLLDSAHYGALKATNKESLTASDVDVDVVAKIQDADKLGTRAVGLAANKRGAAVGLIAPYFIPGAYGSVEQLTYEGLGCPITIATYYMPGKNAIKIIAATYVGVTVTDADAIKPLIAPAPATAGSGESEEH